MSTVGERIAEVLKTLDISARELDRRAGLAEGHVSLTVARLKKNPNASVELPTLKAIARGGKVSEAWLINGVGTPDSDDVQSVSDSHKSELRNRPGWAEAERLARQEHADWPEWVWEATAISSPFEAPVVTLGLVLDVARLVMRHHAPSSQDLARRAEQAAVIEAKVKAFAETGEMGKPPPPDPEPKRGRRK